MEFPPKLLDLRSGLPKGELIYDEQDVAKCGSNALRRPSSSPQMPVYLTGGSGSRRLQCIEVGLHESSSWVVTPTGEVGYQTQ